MQSWVSTVNVCSFYVFLLGRVITVCMHVCFVNCMCMHGLEFLCMVAYRDLLELVREASNIRLGSRVWRHMNCAQCVVV